MMTIDRSEPFNPEIVGRGWTIIEEDTDKYSVSLEEIDLFKVILVSMFQPEEIAVKGEEKLLRLKNSGLIRLDAGIFWFFFRNKHLIPPSWKEKHNNSLSTQYIYFDGTILKHPNGSRHVLCFCWEKGGWNWYTDWLGLDWRKNHLSAVLLD